MILYSDKDDHYSHRVRIVLAEKDIACEIRETNNDDAPELWSIIIISFSDFTRNIFFCKYNPDSVAVMVVFI